MNLSGLNLDFNFVTCVLSNFNFVSVVAFFGQQKGLIIIIIFIYIYILGGGGGGGGADEGPQSKEGFFSSRGISLC